MKRCSRCKKWKEESEFSKDRRRKDGLSSCCKKCGCEYVRKHYRRDKRRVAKYYRYEQCHRIVKGVKQKRCRRCAKWKDESEFRKQSSSKDGLRCWCKSCECEYINHYYRRNRKSVKKYYRYEQCHRLVNGVKEKRCRRCGKWKEESEFRKDLRRKDGLRYWCKECAVKANNKARRRRLAVKN